MKIQVKKNIWQHEPEPIVAYRNLNISYDKIIPVGRYIKGNSTKSDIVIWNRQNKTSKNIEVTVSNGYGLNRAEKSCW